MVETLADARQIIIGYLRDMGHNPTNVIFNTYEARQKFWFIEGEFQSGFLGDVILFEADFNPEQGTLGKFKIIGRKSGTYKA